MQKPRRWSGLQARMTISYVMVTVVAVLMLELVLFAFLALYILKGGGGIVTKLSMTAQQYAHSVTQKVKDGTLATHPVISLGDHGATATVGETITSDKVVVVPYINGSQVEQQAFTFALLITPDKHIFATSYPKRYPTGTPIADLLPDRVGLVAEALQGNPNSDTNVSLTTNSVAYAAEPVWNGQHKLIGVLYIQTPLPSINGRAITMFVVLFVGSSIILLAIVTPIGAFFGMITTFGLVRRLRNLASATTAFADGHYAQRVPVKGKDEVGRMEYQFNRMAEQLALSMAKQKELAESNARLAERSRISRELHDAISQDLFSLRMIAGGLQTAIPEDSPVQPQIVTLEQTTTNMIREMRALLLELRPSQLEHLGLAESLEELAKAYHTRLGITVTTHITAVPLSARIELTLLRIAQEAVTNAARHANASMITLTLEPQPQAVSLTITDNGKGFQPTKLDVQHGLGLRLMQERVEELHGAFLLHSEQCQGTRLQVCLPREVHP
ncbi:MAG: hypothetical protein NVS4B12_07630 [Ktedonobacteraceae bacterium]